MIANSFWSGPNKRQRFGSSVTLLKPHHGFPILCTAGTAVRTNIKAGLKTLQMARMNTVLSIMSEAQLALIGILQADIRRHAKSLMTEKDYAV
jgi:hypothetical protein